MSCDKCGSTTHRDDAMNRRCNSCEHLVRLCICKPKGNSPLMERTFRPKGTSVKAVQVTLESADYAADWCYGKKIELEGKPAVQVPSFDHDALFAELGDYLVLVKGEGFKVVQAAEFEDRYEPARNGPTRSGD